MNQSVKRTIFLILLIGSIIAAIFELYFLTIAGILTLIIIPIIARVLFLDDENLYF